MQLFRFQGDRRRSFICDLLESWDGVLRDLETAMKYWDLPYVHKERPNLGILAAAATRIGYVPFEEYSVQKGWGRSQRLGRADLWLATKEGRRQFDFEAKHISLSFRTKKLVKTIQRHLDIAARDVSNIKYKAEYSIGIVFASLYGATAEDFNPNPFWDQLSHLKQYGGDFCAFHVCEPEIWSRNDYYKDRPGIAVAGRYI